MNSVPKLHKCFLLLIITVGIFILQSCKADDVYYSLNDDTRGFLVFDVGKTFKLKKAETGEVLNFTVTSKDFNFVKEYNASMVSFGMVPGQTYCETGTLNFIDDSNCYRGRIFATTDSANNNLVNIDLGGCFDGQYYQTHEYYGSTDVFGTEYQDSYLFPSGPNGLFYSKEKGILKIVDSEGVIKYSIVE